MSKRWRSHYLPSPRPSIWKRFRSLETRLCTQPCTRFTLPLRSIRPKRLRFGVVRRHWRTYRRQLDRSFNSTLIRIRKCLGIRIREVILRRGSARKFAQVSIELRQLSTMLDRATRGIPADFLDPQGTQLNEVYLIVNAVEGLDPGAYVYHRDRHVLECLKAGNFRAQAGHLGLDQQLPVEAAADIFFLADLQIILGRFGNRGYRAVQLEAGILSGKLYLAAYAQRLSATGLTFYDDAVIRFFSPHAHDKSVIMLLAVGKNAKSMLQG